MINIILGASSGVGKIAASGATNELSNEDSMDVEDLGDKPAGSSEVCGFSIRFMGA